MTMDWSAWGIEKGSSVDDQVIAQVQQQSAVKFPQLYLDLVRYADTASPEIGSFSYGSSSTCISEFFEFSARAEPWSLLWYCTPERVPGLAEGYLPIARDAGGLLICLDFNSPTVAVELFDPDARIRYPVAADFEAFVGLWQA